MGIKFTSVFSQITTSGNWERSSPRVKGKIWGPLLWSQPSILIPTRTSKGYLEKECRTSMTLFFTAYNIQDAVSQEFIYFSMLGLSVRTIFNHLFECIHAFDIPAIMCQWIPSQSACIVWKKPPFFVCSYSIITLLHHSAYHSLFYWSISCTEPDQSISPCIKRELFFTPGQPHWPPPSHFSVYHIHLEVKAPERFAVFRILVLLNDTVMASPLFSTFPPSSWYSVWVFGCADIFSLVI